MSDEPTNGNGRRLPTRKDFEERLRSSTDPVFPKRLVEKLSVRWSELFDEEDNESEHNAETVISSIRNLIERMTTKP